MLRHEAGWPGRPNTGLPPATAIVGLPGFTAMPCTNTPGSPVPRWPPACSRASRWSCRLTRSACRFPPAPAEGRKENLEVVADYPIQLRPAPAALAAA